MNLTTILVQPATDDLTAAYQPVQFVVEADASATADQPGYCDIYFINVAGTPIFYRTLVAFTIADIAGNALYTFDIQDVCQEYIKTYTPTRFDAMYTFQASDMVTLPNNIVKCQCYFRGSTFDGDGLLVPNPTIPVQGTSTTAPTSGTGDSTSHVFYVVNASLKPLDDRKLEVHLNNKRSKIVTLGETLQVYTLSNRYNSPYLSSIGKPNLNLVLNECGYNYELCPIFIKNFIVDGGHSITTRNCFLSFIPYHADGITPETGLIFTPIDTKAYTQGVWYIPVGMNNINAYDYSITDAWMANPTTCVYYRVLLTDQYGHNTWCSPLYRLSGSQVPPNGVDYKYPGYVNMTFKNFFGAFEQVMFTRNEEEHKVQSSDAFRGLKTIAATVSSTNYIDVNTGHRRFNIRSADECSVSINIAEDNIPWLKELLSSPVAFVQVFNNDAAVYPAALSWAWLPVEILDSTVQTKKMLDRFEYIVTVKYRPAQDYINLRN